MNKLDFKKSDTALYSGKPGRWDWLTIPPMRYVMIDGQGDPNAPAYARALAALYPVAYGVKALAKARGADFIVPPLAALWTAGDPAAFVKNDRAAWRWTAMIRLPDDTDAETVATARASALTKLARKKDAATDAETLSSTYLQHLDEGDCLQTLHIGPYTEEAVTLANLHDQVMPDLGLTFAGAHHEIYLSDPRRMPPDRLKTILRQPVRPAGP